MKKIIGWILTILGGYFCIIGVICLGVSFVVEWITPGERITMFVVCAIWTIGCFFCCRAGIKMKRKSAGQSTPAAPKQKSDTRSVSFKDILDKKWMTSQLPALYLKSMDKSYYDLYLRQLMKIGFGKENAGKMFDFECDVIKKYRKEYLLHPQFAQSWFFNLKQPFFTQYPKTKEDLLILTSHVF